MNQLLLITLSSCLELSHFPVSCQEEKAKIRTLPFLIHRHYL